MKNWLALLITFISISGYSQSLDTITNFDYKTHFDIILKEAKKKKSKYFYETQLKKFNANEEQSDLEVLSMLIGYTDNKHYEPYTDIFLDKELYDLIEEGKYNEAISLGNKILETKPFLIKVLRELAYAYRETGNNDGSEGNMEKTRKIYRAMYYAASYNVDNTFFALGPKDGQHYIRYSMGLKVGTMGSGTDKDGYFIDMLETTIANEPVVLHFNIEHAMKHLRGQLGK